MSAPSQATTTPKLGARDAIADFDARGLELLGESLRVFASEARVLSDASAPPGTPTRPHSVVTLHPLGRAGEPTRAVVDEILEFFWQRPTRER